MFVSKRSAAHFQGPTSPYLRSACGEGGIATFTGRPGGAPALILHHRASRRNLSLIRNRKLSPRSGNGAAWWPMFGTGLSELLQDADLRDLSEVLCP